MIGNFLYPVDRGRKSAYVAVCRLRIWTHDRHDHSKWLVYFIIVNIIALLISPLVFRLTWSLAIKRILYTFTLISIVIKGEKSESPKTYHRRCRLAAIASYFYN